MSRATRLVTGKFITYELGGASATEVPVVGLSVQLYPSLPKVSDLTSRQTAFLPVYGGITNGLGVLVSPGGATGIRVPVGPPENFTYRVAINPPDGSKLAPYSFQVLIPSGSSDFDLTAAIPATPTPGEDFAEWLNVVAQVTALRDQAAASAGAAQASEATSGQYAEQVEQVVTQAADELASRAEVFGDIAVSDRLPNPATLTGSAAISNFRPVRAGIASDVPVGWSGVQTVLTKAAMNAAMGGTKALYWPWVVAAPTGSPAPGKFLAYWSTDHDAAGGVYMAYADDLLGPWTVQGFVFRDVVVGDQTETPTVLHDGNQFVMYYHNRNSGPNANTQTTCSATSPDGVTWTRRGFAMVHPSRTGLSGDGHTGYAVVYRMQDRFVAYSIDGGTDYGYQAMWHSMDGATFTMDRRRFGYSVDMTGRANLRLSMSPRLFYWRGQMWSQFSFRSPASGTGTPAESQSVVARVREDLRGAIGGFHAAPRGFNCFVSDGPWLYGIGADSTGLTVARLEA